MSKFAENTKPEYVEKVNDALYGAGKDDAEVKEELLAEAEAIGPEAEPVVKTAGYMGIPKIAWVALIGVGVYYAYSKGMFKKLLK